MFCYLVAVTSICVKETLSDFLLTSQIISCYYIDTAQPISMASNYCSIIEDRTLTLGKEEYLYTYVQEESFSKVYDSTTGVVYIQGWV